MTTRRGDSHGTGGNLAAASDSFRRDVVDQLFEEEADENPLLVITRKIALKQGRTAKSYKEEWPEFQERPLYTQLNDASNSTAGDLTLTVDDSSVFDVSDVIINQRTKERMRITAIGSATAITVTRSLGATAAAQINDNDYLTTLGAAAQEGAAAQGGIVKLEDWKYNFVQEFRDSFNETWVLKNTDRYAGLGMPQIRKARGRDHKKKIEMSMIFGERSENTSNDEAIRSMGGLYEVISTNSTDFGGAVTWEEIVEAAEGDFEYGSMKKMLVASTGANTGLASVAQDALRTTVGNSTFGIRLKMLETQHGDYLVMKHKLLRGNEFTKMAFVIDPQNFGYTPLQNLDTMLRTGIEATGETADKEEWYTAATCIRALEKTHGLWTNVA